MYALPAQNTANYATNTIVRPTAHEFTLQRNLSSEAPLGEVAVLYTAKAVSYRYGVQSTPLPITAELQIEYREFPGPISGANPTFTSLEPEDPGRGAPTRLLGKRASRGTRHKIVFHVRTNQMASKLATEISRPYQRYMLLRSSLCVPEHPLDSRKPNP